MLIKFVLNLKPHQNFKTFNKMSLKNKSTIATNTESSNEIHAVVEHANAELARILEGS